MVFFCLDFKHIICKSLTSGPINLNLSFITFADSFSDPITGKSESGKNTGTLILFLSNGREREREIEGEREIGEGEGERGGEREREQ